MKRLIAFVATCHGVVGAPSSLVAPGGRAALPRPAAPARGAPAPPPRWYRVGDAAFVHTAPAAPFPPALDVAGGASAPAAAAARRGGGGSGGEPTAVRGGELKVSPELKACGAWCARAICFSATVSFVSFYPNPFSEGASMAKRAVCVALIMAAYAGFLVKYPFPLRAPPPLGQGRRLGG